MDEDQDLWERIKAAKTYLFTQTNFLKQYSSSPGPGVHTEVHPSSSIAPDPAQLAMTTKDNSNNSSNNTNNSARSFSVPSIAVTSPSHSPSPTELPGHSLSPTTLSPLVHEQDKQGENQESRDVSSKEEKGQGALGTVEQNLSEELSSGQPVSESTPSLSTAVPVALPSSSTKKGKKSSQPAPLRVKSQELSRDKNTLPSAASQKEPSISDKMPDTDASDEDEVMLKNGRFGVNGRRQAAVPRSRQAPDQSSSSNQYGRFPSPRQHRQTDSRTNIPNPEELGLESNKVTPRRASADNGPSQRRLAGSPKKDPYKPAPQSTQEELKKLQQQILTNAHMNRFKDLDTPSTDPETLAKAREGPGTDLNSDIYRELMRRAALPGKSSSTKSSAAPPSANESSEGSQKGAWVDPHEAQWKNYSESPAVYPVVENGRLILLSEPTPEAGLMVKASGQESGLRINAEDLQHCGSADQAAEHNWGDAFYADWEYRPRVCSGYEAFRDWFRRWLDSTIPICCYVDIYHPAFFDGTAHADGEKSLLIPDFDDHTTRLDWDDEETRLHYHETVEGYCYNWARHIEREKEEEQARRARARNAYIEGIKNTPAVNPQTPKANFYLRPVEFGDVFELLEVVNIFIQQSTLTVDVSPLDADKIRERIETAKREMLPFIVAAERRSARSRDRSSQKILGYALATDTVGDRTAARFTAELELYVRPEYKRRGIGKCLMDKLLEVCDPTYNPLGGYFFDSSWEDRPGYRPGGRRRLARLMFIISCPNDERPQYKWLHEWLQREYGFEQQGLLKGTRVKFNRFLISSYVVRRVGFAEDGTLRN